MARRLAHVRVSSCDLLVGCGDGDGDGDSGGGDGDGSEYGAKVSAARVGAVAGGSDAVTPSGCADAKKANCSCSRSAISANKAGQEARRRCS